MKNSLIDKYIEDFPEETKVILKKVRQIIKEIVPESEETISYQMPTFKLNGKNFVHFAAFKNHLGFYPIPSGIEAFKKELSYYEGGKGSVKFPLDKPIPYNLIKKIVKYRKKEELSK